MKRKVRTRLLSGLLTLVMLISLMPAAFAASYFSGYTDSDGLCYLIDDADFDNESLYNDKDAYYFLITTDEDDAPGVYHDEYRGSMEDELIYYDELDGVYFDESDSDCDESYYVYTIEAYSDESTKTAYYVGETTFRLYVNDSNSGSSADGDIYAEIDKNGYVDLYDYEEELYDYGWTELKGTPDCIRFTSWDNGVLYDEDGEKVSKSVYFDLETSKQESDLYYYGIYFEIDDDSEEAYIDFIIYDDGSDSVSGTIVINSDGSSVGDIEYSTEYNTEVYFDGDDFEDFCDEETGRDLEYVTFTLPSSSKGTLYNGNSKVKSTDEFDSGDLDDVFFMPASGVSGNVSISFKMYYYRTSSSKNLSSVSGTVVISVADGTTVAYTGEVDEAVEFDSEDFDDVCYDVTGKSLDYVKFTLPSSSKGTLYAEYDGTSKGSTAAKSTDKFYVEPDSKQNGLDDVVFVPKTSGTVELTYTAYNTKGSSFTGKVKITTTAGTLKDISYTVGSKGSVTFSASDFTAALKAKTTKTLSSVTFTLPKSTEGVLYYNGTTKVSASTQYKATGTTNTLDKVSFVPASTASGSVTISYTAKDSSGNTYNGAVVVKTFVGQDTVITYSTTGTAVSFKTTDFTNACAKKLGTTLSFVQFALPKNTEGTLYYGWGTSQQARVSANAKYTAATYLPYVSFVPKAGFSGTVNIIYTGYDTANGFYIGTIQVTVTPPTKSATFTDANVSWIAPAADFLQANGVYSGVVSGNTLGVGTSITRGEVMQMIYNAFNLKSKVPSVTSNFTDVPTTSPYYTAINAGYALGIAQGVGDGKYNPNALITREDACTLLYRAFSTLGLNMTTGTADDMKTFGDYATVSGYAVNGVAGMIKSGIIQGDQNGNINPKGNLTRGEMSVIIHRAMTL